MLGPLESVLGSIGKYFLNEVIEIIPGNAVVARGIVDSTCFEIRYVYNRDLYFQILIDDIWDEEYVWSELNSSNNNKVVIYLCSSSIDIVHQQIVIDSTLNMSQYFVSITKYFIPISIPLREMLIDKFPSCLFDDTISTLQNKFQHSVNKISIITTVFNNAKLLEQTIQSVINQESGDFEYIIKDACSTDDFSAVIEKYRPYVSKIISTFDRGIYYGMHEGIENSEGEYVAILNSGDIYSSPKIVQNYIENFKQHPADAYYANLLMFDKENNNLILRKGSIKNIVKESSINHATLFLKRSLYEKVGGFDFSFHIAADGDLTIKLLKIGCTFYYINKETVLFRVGGASNKFNFSLFKEELRCRFRYNKFNFYGYLYVIIKGLKNFIKKYV